MKSKVLIVDDETDLRGLLRDILVENGYQVSENASGKEVKENLSNLNPDVILLDLKLPDADGIELLPFIRPHSHR
jgi:DNA-binding response OmpR family regulator